MTAAGKACGMGGLKGAADRGGREGASDAGRLSAAAGPGGWAVVGVPVRQGPRTVRTGF